MTGEASVDFLVRAVELGDAVSSRHVGSDERLDSLQPESPRRLAGVLPGDSKLSDCRLNRLTHNLSTPAVRSVAIE